MTDTRTGRALSLHCARPKGEHTDMARRCNPILPACRFDISIQYSECREDTWGAVGSFRQSDNNYQQDWILRPPR